MHHSRLQLELKDKAVALFKNGQLDLAKESCLQYCNTDSSDPQVWCLLSAIYGAMNCNHDAEECAQRAIELAPGYLTAHTNLALAKLNLEKFDAAKQGIQKILRTHPKNWQANYYMGLCLEKESGQDERAISYFEIAQQSIPDAHRPLSVSLINAYERIGEINKSQQVVDKYLTKYPDDPEIGLIKARNTANDGNYRAAKDRLSSLLDNEHLTTSERSRLLNQYGLTLDKLGEYKDAYQAFKQCQQIERKNNPEYDGNRIYEKIKHNQAATSIENTSKWSPQISGDEHPAPMFIIGFPRSGTTLLERIVSAHPEITPSSEENLIPRVIDKLNLLSNNRTPYPFNLNDITDDQIIILRHEYWQQVEKRCGKIPETGLFLDKLPLNIIELCFINRIFPEAKILLAIRDPRDVCLSCFMQQFKPNHAMANFYSLEDAARFYDSTMSLFVHYEGTLNLDTHTVRYEDIVSDLETQARDLLDFLELEWDENVLNYSQNRKYKITTPSYHDTCKPIFTSAVERWRNYEKHIAPLMPHLRSHVTRYEYRL